MDKIVLPNEVFLEEVAVLLDEGREVTLSPKGSSMLPFIREGRDSVVLRKEPAVHKGDIVLVRLPGRYVLHRIIRGHKCILLDAVARRFLIPEAGVFDKALALIFLCKRLDVYTAHEHDESQQQRYSSSPTLYRTVFHHGTNHTFLL